MELDFNPSEVLEHELKEIYDLIMKKHGELMELERYYYKKQMEKNENI